MHHQSSTLSGKYDLAHNSTGLSSLILESSTDHLQVIKYKSSHWAGIPFTIFRPARNPDSNNLKEVISAGTEKTKQNKFHFRSYSSLVKDMFITDSSGVQLQCLSDTKAFSSRRSRDTSFQEFTVSRFCQGQSHTLSEVFLKTHYSEFYRMISEINLGAKEILTWQAWKIRKMKIYKPFSGNFYCSWCRQREIW